MLELLVVDPNPISHVLTRYAVREEFGDCLQITELPNGYEARDYIKAGANPNVILMYIDMDHYDGIDAANDMRDEGYVNPFILWTKRAKLMQDTPAVEQPVDILLRLASPNSTSVLEVLRKYLNAPAK